LGHTGCDLATFGEKSRPEVKGIYPSHVANCKLLEKFNELAAESTGLNTEKGSLSYIFFLSLSSKGRRFKSGTGFANLSAISFLSHFAVNLKQSKVACGG
jgi:hypothetical protein